ncbi:aspartate carbamoyltransferase catalytic subunit [Olsenella sp. YH-ols2217]|uniref:Aspartate carbamoyltransferase n=1 Tax=Kribbibacterium absianum TaxID=3044210 RepID=A0ABT6ZK42_9ACTN|nr:MULTISPECIES: aspartate carbamoyltransferase catalytic subunit [unclassified Olsenella]MDJ1121403.1 aspartate carbamoyltransferase catalytic subunit [Olsenella sp. YH-ols2216]MDJ1128893.1 aspartate carbamoyltransferase catalytic subunit [Olsenella sp. YH-ols2217]
MLSVRNLIDTTSLTADDITQILDTARSFDEVNSRSIKKVPALRGRTIVNLFLEPSTRTRSSFELAEKRLSADTLNMGGKESSVVKGESLADTIQTISAMNVDAFVCRASFAGTPHVITENTDAKVINAGDGKHQHPTQAMLDLYTIREHFGHLDGLKVAIVGDLLHSRVAGSLVPALKTMGAEVTLVGPPTFQVIDPAYYGVEQTSSIDDVIEEMDVVYMLRVQLERMGGAAIPSRREYNRLYGLTKERAARMKPGSIVCHPGPMNRGMEIMGEVADAPNSKILDQVNAGVCTRMAALYLLLGGDDNDLA